MFSVDTIISSGISEVGSVNPIYNFRDMLARRDVDLVDKAIEQMKNRIVQLVNDTVRDQLYPKAIDCLQALRAGTIREEESQTFNSFLKELRNYFEGKRRQDFWQMILDTKTTLISYAESEDSYVSPAEVSFWKCKWVWLMSLRKSQLQVLTKLKICLEWLE